MLYSPSYWHIRSSNSYHCCYTWFDLDYNQSRYVFHEAGPLQTERVEAVVGLLARKNCSYTSCCTRLG